MLSNCIRLSCATCLSVTLVATTMAAAPDPIVYYSLDELGGMVIDASGNGMDSRNFEDMTIHSIFGY